MKITLFLVTMCFVFSQNSESINDLKESYKQLGSMIDNGDWRSAEKEITFISQKLRELQTENLKKYFPIVKGFKFEFEQMQNNNVAIMGLVPTFLEARYKLDPPKSLDEDYELVMIKFNSIQATTSSNPLAALAMMGAQQQGKAIRIKGEQWNFDENNGTLIFSMSGLTIEIKADNQFDAKQLRQFAEAIDIKAIQGELK